MRAPIIHGAATASNVILSGRLLIDPQEPPALGWVAVKHERIAAMGTGEPPTAPDAGGPDCLICPGFIDAHLHLPQIDVVGCDGMELLEWLEGVIFPAELKWADEGCAARQISAAYGQMLRAGTLGYAGYLTSHLHGLVELIRAAHRLPLRTRVGQVLMDRHAPAGLLGQQLGRLANSKRGRVTATVNPRFAVCCSDALLARAQRRATDGAYIQTHLAEATRECEKVRELFPEDLHYAGVYDRHGLLTERTLLAHCIHLDDEQWRLIAERRAVIVHCPTANIFLGSGLFDLDAARRHGVRLALGSDIAAGPDLAMPRVARAMIETAKVRAMLHGPQVHVPTTAEVWQLMTRGNAESLGWADAGRLEVGGAADLLVLKVPFDQDEKLVNRLIYTWRDEYIDRCVLNGRLIERTPPP